MSTLLVQHVHTLVTMDDARREINDGALFIRDGVIEWVGKTGEREFAADEVLDLRRQIVLPGMVNTHHHMYQSLTRVIPACQDSELFNWLKTLYPIWAGLRSEHIYVSALLAMAELMLSGCTTSSDHLYIFPNDCRLDDEIQAAQEIGLRFHAMRGSMSLGESKGGLPPDRVVEDEAAILADSRRVIEAYHDPVRYAMLRVGLAPCSPFSVTTDLMRESAALARSYGVRLHTHLAENQSDIDFSREVFGMRPGEYVQDVGWVGDDVWHAHCVKLNSDEVNLFAHTHTGVAHCPYSNARLASGIAPIREMFDAEVPVGLGVDGSASNDSGHLLAEARMAMMMQRIGGNPAGLTARETLEISTRGGAQVLGRDDIGALAVGMAADFVSYDLDQPGLAGALHDPVAALVFCTPGNVSYNVINGRIVVRDGHLTTLDLPVVIERHNRLAMQLVEDAS
ncbi:MAG: 8-oxoguanine deaminase [Anaerolineae bacterium]|nr:8-oxoguanine deaminase [Anaerolineae bacterium]